MLQRLSYQFKLYISFSVIITLILIICGSTFYQYNSKLLKAEIEKSSLDSLALVQSRIEDKLNDMNKILTRLHASQDFMDLVTPSQGESYFSQHPSVTSNVKSMFSSILSTESTSSSLYYTSESYGHVGTRLLTAPTDKLLVSPTALAQQNYLKEGLTTNKYLLFLPPHGNPWTNKNELVFSVVRPIRDMFHTYGVLEYNESVDELDKFLQFSNSDEIHDMILLDQDGSFLYSNMASSSSAAKLYENKQLKDPNGYYYMDKDNLMCYSHSKMTGWTILIRRNIHDTNRQITRLAHMILVFYMIGFIILLLSLYLLTKNLTRPLRMLRNNLSVMELNQDIHIDTGSSNNEVVVLTTAIEDILNKMRVQNTHLIETRKKALKAHFDAMEAQLNPHFLYNTLSVIGSYGLEIGSKTVPKMCSELANLLRYSITYNYKTVSLQDEINNISSYLYIMKMRYEHMLEFTWDVDDSLSKVPVPKLILQPIVENCFQHAFLDMPPVWKIIIRTYRDDNYWYASIANNGKNFEEGKKEIFYQRFLQFKDSFIDHDTIDSPEEKQGFGLENTVMRLSIYYHGKEHFKIYTKESLTIIEIGGVIHEI